MVSRSNLVPWINANDLLLKLLALLDVKLEVMSLFGPLSLSTLSLLSPLKTDAAKINVGKTSKIKWSDNIRDDWCVFL